VRSKVNQWEVGMKIVAMATVAGLAVAAPAVASGPINAPSPVAPDGASFVAYLETYMRTQDATLTRASRYTDRWLDARVVSARGRRARRDHRRQLAQARANGRALARDLAGLNGCQGDLVQSQALITRGMSRVQNAMGGNFLSRIARGERTISFQWGRMDGLASSTAVCLAGQGWQFA
jgi:hypothetical protein